MRKFKLFLIVLLSAFYGTILTADDLSKLTEGILQHRLPDGSLVMDINTPELWVNPYFNHIAIYTALKCVDQTPELEDDILTAAEEWFTWYGEHQDANGYVNDYRGPKGRIVSTGDFDSSDSYAAMYLVALAEYLKVSGNYITGKQLSYAKNAYRAILSTMESDALTWAKPSYHVKYLMDNLEVNIGLSSAEQIFRSCNLVELADSAKVLARNNAKSIDRYEFKDRNFYAVGIMNDGSIFGDMKVYYPDFMANAFAAAMFDRPNKKVWDEMVEKHRNVLAENICARSYNSALRLKDHKTAEAIYSAASEKIKNTPNPENLRLDLLYDLVIIKLADPEFWPQVERITQ